MIDDLNSKLLNEIELADDGLSGFNEQRPEPLAIRRRRTSATASAGPAPL
jgi:hypothetical protein